MKPYLLVFAALIFFSLPLFSQSTSIKGVIKDNKGNPVPGANIAIKDSYDGSTSDSTGKFSFRSSEKGEQLLLISRDRKSVV